MGFNPIRLPHSEIVGLAGVCPLPTLIAAYHVLHRLLAPRHSLCALYNLIFFSKSKIWTNKFIQIVVSPECLSLTDVSTKIRVVPRTARTLSSDSYFCQSNHHIFIDVQILKKTFTRISKNIHSDTLCELVRERFLKTGFLREWWARADSNCRPHDYQSCALTNWATSPSCVVIALDFRPQ